MGVPDFLKFAARSAPTSLCRLPKGVTAAPLEFDYVLVDATNAAQTIGLESLEDFLTRPQLLVRCAIIFALDSQRERAGSSRHYRQTHVIVGDLDVKVQRLCARLNEHFKALERESSPGIVKSPFVLMSGRHVVGEADYKLLDLHRSIMASALNSNETQLPTFLFVSEDSDVLCGTLCGPAPQQVSIATTLHDTTFEVCILRLVHVLTYVAACTDALHSDGTEEEEGKEAEQQKGVEADKSQKEQQLQRESESAAAAAEFNGSNVAPQRAPEQPLDDGIVRRRKQDGPMVATGVRIVLSDSSDDEEEDGDKKTKEENAKKAVETEDEVGISTAQKNSAEEVAEKQHVVTPYAAAVGEVLMDSSVDLVFLFVVVMGNGVNVPPLVRGVTKVDISSCWQAYCAKKYAAPAASGDDYMMAMAMSQESDLGRTLLSLTPPPRTSARDGQATVTLDCGFLQAILEQVHYADAQSRPPVEDEKNRAVAYLSNAVYATLRYIVGCNLECRGSLRESFLDSRPLSQSEVLVPSLAAVLWVLSQERSHTFYYPLTGLAKKELLVPTGASTLRGGRGTEAADAAAPATDDATKMQMDVGEALVAPAATATSWAVRGAGSRVYTLRAVIAAVDQNASTAAPSTKNNATTSKQVSVAALLKQYATAHATSQVEEGYDRGAQRSYAITNTFVALAQTWKRGMALGVHSVKAIATAGAKMANKKKGRSGAKVSTSSIQCAAAAVGAAGRASVYSFELRRMAPVLGTVLAVESVKGTSSTSAPASTAATSVSRQSLMTALGVSLDYAAVKPVAASNLAKLPRDSMDEEDKAELERLKKVARKELRAAREVERAKDKKLQTNKNTGNGKGGKKGELKTENDAEATVKKKRRPGKKERNRLRGSASPTNTTPAGSGDS